ncbi:hypothetical protein CR513_59694, partial [Mucuna pruriens]
MKFTYILARWEGTASNSRISRDALRKTYFLKVSLLGVRYHLKEYLVQGLKNYKELFNLYHSSLRNSFKKSFPIIARVPPHYSFGTIRNIVVAYCILHNFLIGMDSDDLLLTLLEREVDIPHIQQLYNDNKQELDLRDNIATKMFEHG